MLIHIWRMRSRKKKTKDYEAFGKEVTLPSLRKIEGCEQAYFLKVFEAHKPEYFWVVFWRDQKALEQARTNPVWREQMRKFEAGRFCKTLPLQMVCDCLSSFRGAPEPAPKEATRPTRKRKKAGRTRGARSARRNKGVSRNG